MDISNIVFKDILPIVLITQFSLQVRMKNFLHLETARLRP